MGTARAADPERKAGRSPGQDRDAIGDERHSLPAANGLSLGYLPHDGFPPRSTVYNIFREGAWEAIWAELHAALP